MSERKLLVSGDPDGSTFALGFRKATGAATPEQLEKMKEQTMRDVIGELYRPQYDPGTVRDTRGSVAGTNGWISEKPLVNADTDRTNALIEGMCNAHLPPARVEIKSLKGISPEVVRQKLAQAVASGKLTQAQCDEQLALLEG